MRWLLCGLTFALAVGLAIATVAIRAGNAKLRRELEAEHRSVDARRVELERLALQVADESAPEQLAQRLRGILGRTPAAGPGAAAATEAQPWQ